MTEHLESTEFNPVKLHLADAYHSGKQLPKGTPGQVDKFAHDFIIPSAYQVLPQTERLLGQYVNKTANHNNGKFHKDNAGKQNIKYIKKLLKELEKHI